MKTVLLLERSQNLFFKILILFSLPILSACQSNGKPVMIDGIPSDEMSFRRQSQPPSGYGVAIFGVEYVDHDRGFLGFHDSYDAAWMFYDGSKNVFKVEGYNTILTVPFTISCTLDFRRPNTFLPGQCNQKIKYHAFSLPEGSYSLAYISLPFHCAICRKPKLYDLGHFSEIQVRSFNNQQSYSFSPDGVPSQVVPKFNVKAGEHVYVGDIIFDLPPQDDPSHSIYIRTGDSYNDALGFASKLGIDGPVIDRAFQNQTDTGALKVSPAAAE